MKKFKKNLIRCFTLPLLILSCFIGSFLFVDTVKADTPPNVTNYGYWQTEVVYPSQDGFSFGYGPFGVSIPITTGSGFTLVYKFNQAYTGTITVGVTASTNWYLLNDYISLEGGWFQSFPNTTNTNITKSFSIHVDHSEGFTLCIIDDGTNTFANNTVNITFAYSGMTHEETIGSDVDAIRVALDGHLPGMSQSLSDIYQFLDQDINYNLQQIVQYLSNDLDDYMTDFDSYLSLLNTLNDNSTGVGFLQEIYTAIQNLPDTIDYSSYFNTIISSMLNIESDVDSVNTTLSNIYSRLNSMNTTLTAISTSLQSSFHSNLNVPRWQLPAMRWALDVSYTSGQYSSWSLTTSTGWFQRYTNPAGDLAFTSSKAVYVPIDTKYIIAWASVSSGAGCNIYYSRLGSNGMLPSGVTVDEFYGSTSNGGYRDGMYFNYVIITNEYSPSNNEAIGVEIEFTNRRYISPLYVGSYSSMPIEAYSLIGLEYIDPNTSILNNINSTVSNIEEYLSNLSPDQTVIDNSTQIVNNFDTSIDLVNDIESNILTDIDVQFDNVNQIIIDQSMHNVHPVSADQGVSLFEFYFSRITYAWPAFKYPVYLLLILFVLLCLLG